MSLIKKIILGILIFVTIGSGVAAVFFPPLAAVTGGAITGIVAIVLHHKVATKKNSDAEASNNSQVTQKNQEVVNQIPITHNLHFSYHYHAEHKETSSRTMDIVDVTLDDYTANTPKKDSPKLK
jgi:hypothetical protein